MPIREREGHWHYRVWVQGREYTGSTDLRAIKQNAKPAKAFAERRRGEILAELSEERAEPRTFDICADEFLKWCFASQYRSKPSTARRIATSVASCIPFFEKLVVANIRAADIERYKVFRAEINQVKDVTIRHDLHALSLFFKFAVKFGWCNGNPTYEVTKPSDVDAVRINVLNSEQEAKYFAAASGASLYDVARLILLQGCRPEEIFSLRQADVDLAEAKLYIRGGKSRAARRTLDLTGESIEILKRRLSEPSEWVFPSRKTNGHLQKVNSQHDQACLDSGVSFVLYDLRHTFATRLAQSGCDVVTLAAILGHSGLRLVVRYVHPTAEHKKAAMKKYEQFIKPQLQIVGAR